MVAPTEMREFALECLRWSDETDNASHREIMIGLARTWMRTASQIDRRLLAGDELALPDLEANSTDCGTFLADPYCHDARCLSGPPSVVTNNLGGFAFLPRVAVGVVSRGAIMIQRQTIVHNVGDEPIIVEQTDGSHIIVPARGQRSAKLASEADAVSTPYDRTESGPGLPN